MYEFLDQIPGLSKDEREKLIVFGAQTPLGLLSLIEAAPDEFRRYFGRDRTDVFKQELSKLVSRKEREEIDRLPASTFQTGARVDAPAPPLKEPGYDLTERDHLFSVIQELKTLPDKSPAQVRYLKELEGRLESLMERS